MLFRIDQTLDRSRLVEDSPSRQGSALDQCRIADDSPSKQGTAGHMRKGMPDMIQLLFLVVVMLQLFGGTTSDFIFDCFGLRFRVFVVRVAGDYI